MPSFLGRQLGSLELDQTTARPRALRKALKELFYPYHPERHYMRGPGPRWREKQHALNQTAACTEAKGK